MHHAVAEASAIRKIHAMTFVHGFRVCKAPRRRQHHKRSYVNSAWVKLHRS